MAVKRAISLACFYPDNECVKLKEVISQYIGQIESSNIFVGNGATEIIHLFARAFIRRGAEAIVAQPTFSEYEYATLLQGGSAKHVPRTGDFELDPSDLLERITPHTAAIFLCNPNNPTSTLENSRTIERIVRAAANVGAMVLLDESFMDFIEDPAGFSLTNVATDYRNLLIVRSLTKTFGLAGLRVGYAIGHMATMRRLENIKVTWSVNAFAQTAAAAALKDKNFLRRSLAIIRTERSFLERSLRELGLRVTPPKANFLLGQLPVNSHANQLKNSLIQRRILIRECSRFRGLGSHFIRIAVKTRR
jgi:histidinol-phosphate aminotransferase